jgi:hypothetical protein
MRPIASGGWQQGHVRLDLVEVLDDRQRLADHALAVDQRRHELLRVEVAIGGGVLLASLAQQVHGLADVAKALDLQCDPDTVAGARSPVVVQRQLRCRRHAPAPRLPCRRVSRAAPAA